MALFLETFDKFDSVLAYLGSQNFRVVFIREQSDPVFAHVAKADVCGSVG